MSGDTLPNGGWRAKMQGDWVEGGPLNGVFRYLLKVLLFLVVLAIAASAYLLATEGRSLDWRQLAEMPEFRAPRWEAPDWERLKFWEREEAAGAEKPPGEPGAKWIARPGEEPPEYAPFTPGPGVTPRFPPGTYFRWQDAGGAWHYTPQPQEGVRNYPVATDPQRNVMPAR